MATGHTDTDSAQKLFHLLKVTTDGVEAIKTNYNVWFKHSKYILIFSPTEFLSESSIIKDRIIIYTQMINFFQYIVKVTYNILR